MQDDDQGIVRAPDFDRAGALQRGGIAFGIDQFGQTLQRDQSDDDVDGNVHLLSMT